MNDQLYHDLLATLVFLAAVSAGTTILGLSQRRREFWYSFWIMTGGWAVIDGLVGSFALLVGPIPLADLSPILRFNAGLDGVYVAAGAILSTRPSARWSGFGLAIVFQGLLLMMIDVYFWQRCEAILG
ncbi:hypothetical protein BH11PLA2_BH11PLA2_08490 [soil metagenome]